MALRVRLILLVLAVLLPAVGAAAWAALAAWRSGQAALERQASEDARALSRAIDREFTRYAAIARALAASPLLDHAPRLSEPERAAFDRGVRRAIDGSPVSVELLSASVRWLDTRLPVGAPPSRRPSGTPALVASSGVRALERGEGLAWVEPVFRQGPGPAMNLRLVVPPAELQRLMDQRSLREGWGRQLLDPRGRVVARRPAPVAAEAERALDGLIRESLAGRGEGRFALRTPAGVPLRVHFSRTPQGWTALTTVPRAPPPPAFAGGGGGTLLATLVLLALAVAGAAWVARAELHRQLAEAVERARQAERGAASRERVEALGRLTGRVAHEFNNLLGVISNSAYLIQRQATQPALAMPVAATLRAVEAASRLTQQLLRFGGRPRARPRTLSLSEWLPERRDLLGVVLGRRVELHIEVPDEELNVCVDPDELELALVNLALNARDTLSEGGRVWVGAERASAALSADLPDGRYLGIALRDSGPGLEAARSRRVFEPFFMAQESTPESGLGLSQVRGLCAQAGGKAVRRQRPGQGSEVVLVLPAVAAEAPDEVPPRTAAGGDGLAPLRARVLLAEDNDALGDVTEALIESMGARVERAAHAAQALERLERGPAVDVLLTDLAMPGALDGLDLARTVRRRWPGVRVVLISAQGDALAEVENFPVLRKPCAPAVLLAALRPASADGWAAAPGAGTPCAP
ncbi:response regulator [Hydrogenophaga sp. SNF1]|uniref:response regulator n=1 Tax=Hydrogenophaga sp. SNF1 TaxID=3098762 RepID=UPI002ACC23D1|nr:response regulator [Hydrogenophaga sp. SNF1]WQB82100.1 response regulator [Hydrogenophaga sp. SNF1]